MHPILRSDTIGRLGPAVSPSLGNPAAVSIPTVWKLGYTSLLTDVSSEMVRSILPVYLVLHLHLSPLQYGAIDGTSSGVAVALLSLAAGVLADRTHRHKEVAAAGYGLSALCKLLLVAVGGAWGAILAVVALDRIGKGVRTAPRDALISLNSSGGALARAFALHRALDAGGALLGPVIAFALIAALPEAFDAVWATSFVFALLGWAVLWLFVRNAPNPAPSRSGPPAMRNLSGLLGQPRFRALAGAGTLLSLATIGDGFLYLLFQQRSGLAPGVFPLYYVMTAGCTMLVSVPVGKLADAWGRKRVFLSGYVVMGMLYLLLLSTPSLGFIVQGGCLILVGLYYAATDGVLAASASAAIPAQSRTSGLAMLSTVVGLGKTGSALLFGWLWQAFGARTAVASFMLALVAALVVATLWIHETRDE